MGIVGLGFQFDSEAVLGIVEVGFAPLTLLLPLIHLSCMDFEKEPPAPP